MGTLNVSLDKKQGTKTWNRNSERELGMRAQNRNSEQEFGEGTRKRNSEQELRNQNSLWPHCVAQVLKDSAFAVVHNAFFFFSAEKVKQAKLS